MRCCRKPFQAWQDLDPQGASGLLELHPEYPGLAAGGGQGRQGGGLHVPLEPLPHQSWALDEKCCSIFGAELTEDDDLEQPVDTSWQHSFHGQVRKPLKHSEIIVNYLSRDKYTIQLWTDASNPSDLTIKTVAEKGFKMIFSNHDATYLDCGFGAWVRLSTCIIQMSRKATIATIAGWQRSQLVFTLQAVASATWERPTCNPRASGGSTTEDKNI